MDRIRLWLQGHPRLSQWIVLAVGMVVILLWASWSVPLLWFQRLAMVAATVALAGACVWIIHWE